MSRLPKAAILQVNAGNSLDLQQKTVDILSRQAVAQGAELLVLPEAFVYYGEKNLGGIADLESQDDGPVRSQLSALAAELQTWIVGGTLPLWPKNVAEKTKPVAATLVFDTQGRLQGRYDKIHLYDVNIPTLNRRYRESDSFSHGSGETLVFDSPIGKVGVIICFDLRFPALALQLRDQGAQVIVVPSAFTRETGKAHWRLLLQARALDTQCYMLGADLAGRDVRKPVWGGSAAVDPWGRLIEEMDDQDGFILVEIDLDRQASVRENLPIDILCRV